MRKRLLLLISALSLFCVLVYLVYHIPPVYDRLAWRVDNARAQIKYAINPPEEVVFVPQLQETNIPQITITPSPTTTSTSTTIPTKSGPTATQDPTFTPTVTATSIPDSVTLTGIVHEYQKWNNCGPANLSMLLSYWDWQGDQRDTAAYLKPNQRDKNVMPYEMAEYVEENTELKIIVRVGGDLEILKHFVAAGIPVLVEKGFEGAHFDGWMGHYEVINGYDETRQRFVVQDSYIKSNLPITYVDMHKHWQAFNYTYIVVYPPEREDEVISVLGAHFDKTYNYQQAAQKASQEIFTTTGREKFFAWYNRGTNLVQLQDYAGAAAAYDEAFSIYPSIPEKERPWRMVWYQTGPYFAYYWSGRYWDVISLATTTIDTASEPAIEESFYWRAMAREAVDDREGALRDYRTSLEWHPDFGPTLYQLQLLGVEP